MKKIIYLKRLRLSQSIGIHSFEREAPQLFLVDIELFVDEGYWVASEKIEDAIDYDVIRDRVKAHMSIRHFNLQETVVQDILSICFDADSRIDQARIRTSKPDVYPDCDAVGLDYTVTRAEFVSAKA